MKNLLKILLKIGTLTLSAWAFGKGVGSDLRNASYEYNSNNKYNDGYCFDDDYYSDDDEW